MDHKRHVWVAVTMYTGLVAFFWFQSGATLKVKLADAIPLTLGFLLPALLMVRSVSDYKARFVKLLVVVLIVLLIYDVSISQLVVKHDLFYFWYATYPLGALLLMTLHFIHAIISKPSER